MSTFVVAVKAVDRTYRGILVAILCFLVLHRFAVAYTPESPVVREVVAKGVQFLEKGEEFRLGGKCLMALVLVKEGRGADDRQVQDAVRACRAATSSGPENISEDIYSTGLAVIFLAELDAKTYEPEIRRLLQSLQLRQKVHGGWGYPLDHFAHAQTGDTSMTQYAVLALWTARRQGISVPDHMLVRVCNWLLRTQDPSGAWGYQGRDPGNYQRVQQTEIRPSLSAAGLGSLYICGDALGLTVSGDRRARAEVGGLPSAFKPVGQDGTSRSGAARRAERVDLSIWRRAIQDGDGWFKKNFVIAPPIWKLYYLYALERYRSFRELAEGSLEQEPDWYNQGVELLMRSQEDDGSWSQMGSAGAEVSTAFALLFLTRSTQRSIQKGGYGEGRLTGGRGLPADVARVQLKRGKIVSQPLGVPMSEALAILEKPDHPEYDALADAEEEPELSQDPGQRSRQVARLHRLIQSGSYQARAAAVRILSQRRDLDDVPYLIFALRDPDPSVRREAESALRLISRRLVGAGADEEGSGPRALAARVQTWKQWYRSIRPQAQFLDE